MNKHISCAKRASTQELFFYERMRLLDDLISLDK